MKRFKRPISEVAKGLFHQGSGDSKPVIPNLGVNSKKAEGDSPAKMLGPAAIEHAKNTVQKRKNAETRKSGKAVSYKDAYADADKKKYKTYEEFEKAAKSYNTKKYDSTNPTADAKKAGKTKAQLAKDVADKKVTTTNTDTKVEETKVEPKDKVTVAKDNLKKTKKDNKVEKLEGRAEVAAAKGKDKKASRLTDKAERKATGKTRKEQGRNFFGGKTKARKRREAAEAAAEKLAAKSSSAAKYKKAAPTKKALVGKQGNLPPEIQAKIKAAPGKYGKKHK